MEKNQDVVALGVSRITMVHSLEGIMPADDGETAINATVFKAQCLALIDAVAEGKASRAVLTRRGRPVAALVP